jgi:hypothetical protein
MVHILYNKNDGNVSMAFPEQIFTKLTNAQQHCVLISSRKFAAKSDNTGGNFE